MKKILLILFLFAFINSFSDNKLRDSMFVNTKTNFKTLICDSIRKGQVPYAFSRTQWSKTITNQVISAGTNLNLLTLIPNDSIVVNGTDGFGRMNISANKIMANWYGVPMVHIIRCVINIQTGVTQTYNLELRRFSDNSVISSKTVGRNNDTPIASELFMSYTSSATDPFVTGGFYISFNNTSGSTATLINSINVLITTLYQ